MAKLCSYYPLHFMRAVIIVNPRGLLYHVRGSREGDGVGWCMANWKCHSYLFISDTRPLYTHARGRTHTHARRCAYTCRSAHTHMYIRTRKQVHPHTHTHTVIHMHLPKHSWTQGSTANIYSHRTPTLHPHKHTHPHTQTDTHHHHIFTLTKWCVFCSLHLKLLP